MGILGDNSVLKIFVFIGIVLFLVLLLFVLAGYFQDFRLELKSINCEIERSEGRERKHWKKQRRRLWLSLIPFVRYR